MRINKTIFGSTIIFFLALSTHGFSQHSTWKAPATVDKISNPLKDDPASVLEGKKIYENMCSICHGEKGKGNGVASASLTPHPANFLAPTVRQESDGAIFWKLSEGNSPMASYKSLLSETQRWQLVNFTRKLEASSR